MCLITPVEIATEENLGRTESTGKGSIHGPMGISEPGGGDQSSAEYIALPRITCCFRRMIRYYVGGVFSRCRCRFCDVFNP